MIWLIELNNNFLSKTYLYAQIAAIGFVRSYSVGNSTK
jgi:hypothetical protein